MKKVNLLSLIVLSQLAMACTQTMIVYKPSKNIDPMPTVEVADVEVTQAKTQVDPMATQQWGLQRVGVNKEELKLNGDLEGNYNIKVAILSTGVDYNHQDLIGQISVNTAEITKDGLADKDSLNQKDDDKNGLVDDIVGYDVVDNDGLAYDHHGAGTAVAGIIAAKANNSVGVAGIMKKVNLYPIRYINDNGQTNLANLLKALDITIKVNPDVAFIQQFQFRLGGRESKPEQIAAEKALLKEKLDKLKELKIPVVVGAGENIEAFGTSELDKVIRGYDNIIIVTSSDQSDELSYIAKYSFSSVHTAAPGENILTTAPQNKYKEVSGTAYAAAHVTAAIALAKAKYAEKKSLQELVSTLLSDRGSDYIMALSRYSRGGNRLNVVKYLSALDK